MAAEEAAAAGATRRLCKSENDWSIHKEKWHEGHRLQSQSHQNFDVSSDRRFRLSK